MFYGTKWLILIYFDGVILLIFLEQCDFLQLTMQGFINDKNDFLMSFCFSYWTLSHFIFEKLLFS